MYMNNNDKKFLSLFETFQTIWRLRAGTSEDGGTLFKGIRKFNLYLLFITYEWIFSSF